MTTRLSRSTAAVATWAVVAVLFWRFRIIAPATDITFGASDDPYGQIYPMAYRAAEWIRAGIFPLWNPYQFAGHPFLATVLYGVFYPPNVLLLVMPTQYAMEASAVLHLFLAGLFTYLYLREVGLAVLPAFAGGLTFALSGFYASQALWFMPAWGAGVWLPLALLAVERVVPRRSVRAACLLALCVALPIFAGWLQTWVYTMYGVVGYLAFRAATCVVDPATRRSAVAGVALGAAAIAIGVALAAVQLLPSFELQTLGPRHPGGLSTAQSLVVGAISPTQLLGEAADPTPGFPRPAYVGELWLLLGPIAVVAATRRARAAFFLGMGVVAVLVTMTVYTPVYGVFRMLPASTWFRFPNRILYLYAFSAAVLFAYALDAVSRAAPRSRQAVVNAALAAAIGVSWLAWPRRPPIAAAYLATGVALLCAHAWSRAARTAILAAFVVVHGVNLFFATKSPALHPYHSLAPYDTQRAALDDIRATQGFWRTYIHFPSTQNPGLMPKQGTLRGIYSITDYEPLSLERTARYYHAMERPPDPGREPPPFIGIVDVDPTPLSRRLLDMLSVRFAVVPKLGAGFGRALAQHGWVPQRPLPTSATYLNPTALPRAYVVHDAIAARSEDEAFAAITSPGFDPHHTVVLESLAALPPADTETAAGVFPEAVIERYEPNHVAIRVTTTRPGWLVLTDTWYPGWRAAVDGVPQPIARANYLFRAVAVTGPATITFDFAPTSVRAGAAISVAALAAIVAGFVAGGRARSAPPP